MPVANSPPSCSAFNSNSRFRRTRAGERRLLAKASPAGLFLTISLLHEPLFSSKQQSDTSTDPAQMKTSTDSNRVHTLRNKAHQSFPIPNSTVTLSKRGRLLTKEIITIRSPSHTTTHAINLAGESSM